MKIKYVIELCYSIVMLFHLNLLRSCYQIIFYYQYILFLQFLYNEKF